MNINRLATSVINDVFFDQNFRNWYESFLPYIDRSQEVVASVSSSKAYKYEGDFYGLLDELSIPKHYHYFVLVYNGYTHPGQYEGHEVNIKIPDINRIDVLKGLYLSRSSYL